MQKWEYLFVGAEEAGRNIRPRYINDQEVPNWKKGQTLFAYANEMGKQGWELVSAPYTGDHVYGTKPRLIFKRPISN